MPFPYLDLLVDRFRDGPRADPSAVVPAAVLLGDSVLERASDHDTDKTSLGEMIRARLPVRCLLLTAPAYSPVHYADYARVLSVLPTRPRLVIAPVNIRCLSPQWDALPRYRRLNHRAAIHRFLEDPDGPVPDLPPNVEGAEEAALRAETRAIPLASPITGATTLGALEDIRDSTPADQTARWERARQIAAYHYGLPAAADHPCLVALGEMARVLRGCGVRVLFYATPINTDQIDMLCGDAVRPVVAAKVGAARDAILRPGPDDPGVAFLDLHDICRAEHFLHRAYMVEHMDQHGRQAVADAVVTRSERFLQDGENY
ncbi:MAG: hypothetical protein P1U88_21445 [Thalassobaculaceae bacterium]|nr:hypothetical protein [Thalassobaculaceae bacterium]